MQLKRGSATVSVALAGVSPASLTIIPPTPMGEEAGAARVFGETPKTAVETTALPNPIAWFQLRVFQLTLLLRRWRRLRYGVKPYCVADVVD
jgi:hypothetical protein